MEVFAVIASRICYETRTPTRTVQPLTHFNNRKTHRHSTRFAATTSGKDEADRERDNDIAAGPRCGGVRECMMYKTGEYVHIRGGDFGAAGMEDVNQVGIARVEYT